ncbi:MAG: glutamine cyclotransferase, partial [Muribaculaceae bacterium]|nr:glutamine cyclotransferase [Muribaculaceae bacterium]
MRNAILFLLCVCLAASCSTSKKSRQESMPVVSIAFNADSAYAFCAAQCNFGPRTMNSEAHDRCADW